MSSKKMNACGQCVRNCVLIHKLDSGCGSATVTSFFKVMFGDKYDQQMFLPPKFSASMKKLVDQETYLEDAYRQRWPVRVSLVEGSLAFKQGWNKFFVDHGMQLGYIVVFYFLDSHFDTKIYDRSCCEKLKFPVNDARNKRRQAMAQSQTSARSSTSHPAIIPDSKRSQVKPREEFMNDSFYVSQPVVKQREHEDGRVLFDLSEFEMNCRILSIRPVEAKAEVVREHEEEQQEALPAEPPQNPMPDTSLSPPLAADFENLFMLSIGGGREHEEVEKTDFNATILDEVPALKMELEDAAEAYEVPPLTIEPPAEDHLAVVPFSAPDSGEAFGLADNPSFIELSSKFAWGGRCRKGRKFITIEDPQERQWPMVYCEKQGVNMLTAGWRAFYEANRIRPGDQCFFQLKNMANSVYKAFMIQDPSPLQLAAS